MNNRQREAEALRHFRNYGIDAKQVRSVYSGKPGCACGCRGKYSYASEFRAESSQDRGYPVTDDDVNNRTVLLIANKMKRFLQEDFNDERFLVDDDYKWIAYTNEQNTRTWTVYFRN